MSDLESAARLAVEQVPEDARRVEGGEAEPVDRPVRRDERADDSAAAGCGPEHVDAARGETLAREAGCVVAAALPEEARARSELRCPGGDVRGLAARAEQDPRVDVPAGRDPLVETDEDVEREVPEGADEHTRDRKIRGWTATSDAASGPSSSAASSARPRPSQPSTGGAEFSDAEAARAGSRPSRARPATSSCSSRSARAPRSSTAVSLRTCRSTSTAVRTRTRSSSSRR